MESFYNQASQNQNFETSEKFNVRQEISYYSALAFAKYDKLQFVDKASGNIHYELDFIMVDTCQENPLDEPEYAAWNKDGTCFFFLGYVDPIHDLHNYKARWKRWARVFVVLDVANKAILKTYGPDVKNPRWNAEGTAVLFDNQPTEITDFDDFIAEKPQDYASGLSSTFKKAFNGETVVEEKYDEDLIPLEFMAGRTVLAEQFSPDNVFCVRFYSLFTPKNEPLRMTFSVFQNYNNNWHPIYDLPNSNYVVDGGDYFAWNPNSHALSFSVNHLERVFFFDFFYHKVVQYIVPQDFTECNWKGTAGKCLYFKTPRGVNNFYFSFPETPVTIYKQWKGGKTVMLSRMSRIGDAEPYLYKVSFVSMEGGTKVAICPDYFVQDGESIKISEDGWTTFQAFDANRSKQFLVYCDLKTLGEGNEFKVASWELPLVPERFDWDENKEQPEQSRWQPIIHGHRVIRHQLFDNIRVINIPLLSKNSNMLAPANSAKLVVCTTQIPDKPSLFQVSIVDSEQKHCYVRLPYYLTVEDAVRQSGSIVCLYAPVALGATTYCIVRFDMQDICNHEKLVIDVWDLHTTPTRYEWDERAARWWPVINGVSVHPGRFYYDDQFMESVQITRP